MRPGLEEGGAKERAWGQNWCSPGLAGEPSRAHTSEGKHRKWRDFQREFVRKWG